MENIIIRIDDRLIHGQVLVGWCNSYHFKKFIICDDEILENEWEKNLLLTAAPSNLKIEILSSKDTCQFIKDNFDTSTQTLILVNSPKQIKKMREIGLPIKTINIGGIHYKENRKQYLLYLFLDEEEVRIFKDLITNGYIFECQDLPTNKKYDLKKVLESSK